MRITLVCVGRLKSGPERELFERYYARLKATARSAGVTDVDVREIDEFRARRPEDRRAEEAAALDKALGLRDALVALDERGHSPSSASWAADIARARNSGTAAYVVVIGGPDGLSASLRTKASTGDQFRRDDVAAPACAGHGCRAALSGAIDFIGSSLSSRLNRRDSGQI